MSDEDAAAFWDDKDVKERRSVLAMLAAHHDLPLEFIDKPFKGLPQLHQSIIISHCKKLSLRVPDD